jgi:hypothetical protein
MSANQLGIIVDQVILLAPDELVKLIKKLVELLEQKHAAAPRRKVDYEALIVSGKSAFATPKRPATFCMKNETHGKGKRATDARFLADTPVLDARSELRSVPVL